MGTFKELKNIIEKSNLGWEMRIRNSDSRFVHVINEYLYCVQTLCQAQCQKLHGQPCPHAALPASGEDRHDSTSHTNRS